MARRRDASGRATHNSHTSFFAKPLSVILTPLLVFSLLPNRVAIADDEAIEEQVPVTSVEENSEQIDSSEQDDGLNLGLGVVAFRADLLDSDELEDDEGLEDSEDEPNALTTELSLIEPEDDEVEPGIVPTDEGINPLAGPYTVTFYTRAGLELVSMTVDEGDYIDPALVFYEMDEYYRGLGYLRGWQYESAGDTIPFNYAIPIYEDIDVYAVWQNTGLRISYDLNGGTGELPVDLKSYDMNGVAQALSTQATRSGLVFYAWVLGGSTYYPLDIIDIATTESLTMVAQYVNPANLVTVSYVSNTPGAPLQTIDRPMRLPFGIFRLPGSIFNPVPGYVQTGWTLDSTDTVTVWRSFYEVGQNMDGSSSPRTFYGTWAKAPLYVTYETGTTETVTGMPDPSEYADPVYIDDNIVVTSAVPSRSGYRFGGWTNSNDSVVYQSGDTFVMPGVDVTMTVLWVTKTDTPYTVFHYDEVNNDVLLEENLTGTTGVNVSADPQSFAGYTFNAVSSRNKPDGIITGDGLLVLELYYTRLTNTRYTVLHIDERTNSVLYTENLTGTTATPVTAVPRTIEGYSYNSANTNNIVSGTILGNGSLVLRLYYTPATDTPYTVFHYDEVNNDVLLEENLTGTTGVSVSGDPQNFPGYTFNVLNTNNNLDGVITADVLLVLELYYTPQTVSYIVRHVDPVGGGTVLETETFTGRAGQTAIASAISIPGYTYDPTHPDNVTSGTIAGDGSLVLVLNYTRNSNTAYTVLHLDAVDSTLLLTENLTGTTATTVYAVPQTIAGYSYDSTDPRNVNDGIVAGDGSLVLRLYYTRNTNTAYRVFHINERTDAILQTQSFTGVTLSTVNASAISITNFTYNAANPSNQTSGIVAGDGSLILRLYYTPDQFRVSYAYTGTVPAGAPAVPASYMADYMSSYNRAGAMILSGWIFNGWGTSDVAVAGDGSFVMPAHDVAFAGSWSIGNAVVTVLNSYAGYSGAGRYDFGNTVTIYSGTRAGYIFTFWTDVYNLGIGFANGGAPTTSFTMPSFDVTVSANWRANPAQGVNYTVTFVDWDGTVLSRQTVPSGGSATAPANPTRSGYVFAGWNGSYTNVTANVTITATYTPETSIPDPSTPLNSGGTDKTPDTNGKDDPVIPVVPTPRVSTWALINLILAIVGVFIGLIVLIRTIMLRREDEDEETGETVRRERRPLWIVIVIILAVLGVILFVLTEDMRNPMTYVDRWTLLHAVIFIIELIAMLLTTRKVTEEEDRRQGSTA